MKKFLSLIIVYFLFLSAACAQTNPLRENFEQAIQAYAAGDYQRSADLLQQTIKVAPNFAQAYNYLGLVRKELGGDYREILDMFQEAVRLKPDYAEAYENLGKVYYGLGQFVKAEENMNKALAINPHLASSHLALGWIYLLGKSVPAEAIPHFEMVVKERSNAYALFGLGMAYFMNDERYKVLEIITSLRGMSQEKYASELENMVRDKHYVPSKNIGLPVIDYEKSESLLVEETAPTVEDVEANYDGAIKVRLRSTAEEPPPGRRWGKNSKTDEAAKENSAPVKSGADRLRELQKRWESLDSP